MTTENMRSAARCPLLIRAAISIAAVLASATPAIASSEPALAVSRTGGETEPLAAHFNAAARTLYIGTAAESSGAPEDQPHVTYSRAADLVGQSVTLISPIWSSAPSTGPASMPSILPLASSTMTSGFGMREHPLLGGWRAHSGVDLAARMGTPILATSDGTVERAHWQGGYGLFVALDHGGGVETRYGHMSGLNVNQGQHVRRGDVIGYVGSTGMSTGPHLHYEIRMNGRAINPSPMLRPGGASQRSFGSHKTG